MRETAVILTHSRYATSDAKTAHGMVRGPCRYSVVGVIDAAGAGSDAGEVLDGVHRGIAMFADLDALLAGAAQRPKWCVIGVATSGGVLPEALRATLEQALERGIGVVNGLHEILSDDPRFREAARRGGAEILDIRKPKPRAQLHFWSGEIARVRAPRIAVLGTDCALGKRTTCQLLATALRERKIATEIVYTGQTGWLQGCRFGFVLDSTPNDFVSGELEHAITSCDREAAPDLILLEGQSALRNPSGPCGAELMLSGGAAAVILQHAPARKFFDDQEELGNRIPSLASEIALIGMYGAAVIAIALNHEHLPAADRESVRSRIEAESGKPAFYPLLDDLTAIAAAIEEFLARAREEIRLAAMKIAAVRTRTVRAALTRPYAIAGGHWDHVELVLCEIEDASGRVGYGQASPAEEVTGESFSDCAEQLAEARLQWLVGREAGESDRLDVDARAFLSGPAARAALDMALADLRAKQAGLPLVEQLGRVHSGFATSITIGVKSLSETLEEAREYQGRGFRLLKLKIGVDVDADLEKLRKLREVHGNKLVLRADANQGYDARALERFLTGSAGLDLELLEQPLARGEEALLKSLGEAQRRKIVADESIHDLRDLERAIAAGPTFGVVNVKLMKCGGIAEALRMAKLAQRSGIELMWGCMDESLLGIAAALHTALACPATRYLDLDGSFDLAQDPFSGGFSLTGDRLDTLDRPGLGAEPS